MTLDRRTFILQGATLLAVSPSLGMIAPGVSAAQIPPIPQSDTHANSIRFQIDGWDRCETDVPNPDEVWLRLNQSWRVAWR
jgi:hypothetical protein